MAGILEHSISILMETYARWNPNMQGEAAQLMEDILTKPNPL
jgi:hypothetical protein